MLPEPAGPATIAMPALMMGIERPNASVTGVRILVGDPLELAAG
ncbi:hypothetical protein FP2506_16839 [Fulvimarina pelagi HTCC2506]|uniref:Uncharacterized protein n=1 Tax=Fulvimarina pelagi HTCC2506 TaxID=314231 RepID=Q0G2R2_9HYPH|nr:hypothetical protein FP2506_16839 [Fulvimarina pelagi HTCC2506]